jgi:hypothetical protein
MGAASLGGDPEGLQPHVRDARVDPQEITYSQVVTREDETGPRTLRVVAQSKGDDGRVHAVAVDFGTLTVVASE